MVQTWVEQHASLGGLILSVHGLVHVILRNHNHFAQDVIFSAGILSVVPLYQDKQCKQPYADRPHDCVASATLHIPSFLPRFGMRILCAQPRDLTIFWDGYEYQWRKSCSREGPS